MAKNSTIQIIAGKYRGKKLFMADKTVTRSSKSILKESLFNSLSFEIFDSVFVEVFGGSGSIGLEAISRGAKKSYFIEKDRESFLVLKKNCKLIDESATVTHLGSGFELLPQICKELESEIENVYYYLDPPFNTREGQMSIYDECIRLIKKIPPKTIRAVIIEHLSSEVFPEVIAKLSKTKTKRFGKSSLSYYTITNQEP